jgi:hypothetical protein
MTAQRPSVTAGAYGTAARPDERWLPPARYHGGRRRRSGPRRPVSFGSRSSASDGAPRAAEPDRAALDRREQIVARMNNESRRRRGAGPSSHNEAPSRARRRRRRSQEPGRARQASQPATGATHPPETAPHRNSRAPERETRRRQPNSRAQLAGWDEERPERGGVQAPRWRRRSARCRELDSLNGRGIRAMAPSWATTAVRPASRRLVDDTRAV